MTKADFDIVINGYLLSPNQGTTLSLAEYEEIRLASTELRTEAEEIQEIAALATEFQTPSMIFYTRT